METEIHKKVLGELLDIGYNIKHRGTLLLTEAICIAYEAGNTAVVENIEKNLYITLAKKYNKSTESIKMDIVNATNIILSKIK